MKSKKSEMSIRLVIAAVIALMVLVVLASFFMSRAKIFGANAGGTCLQQGGSCAGADGNCPDDKPLKQIASCSRLEPGCNTETKQCSCCLPLKR